MLSKITDLESFRRRSNRSMKGRRFHLVTHGTSPPEAAQRVIQGPDLELTS